MTLQFCTDCYQLTNVKDFYIISACYGILTVSLSQYKT